MKTVCRFISIHTAAQAFHFALHLVAYIIQKYTGASDRKVCQLIAENPYLSVTFWDFEEFQHKCPFSFPALVSFRKRFTAEFIMKINEMFLESAAPTASTQE